MAKIKLKDISYCEGCPFLYFDKEKSNPSEFLGEGYYVHTCNLYDTSLAHYLHNPLRLDECKETLIKGAEERE